MIDMRRRIVKNSIIKHVFSIEKKIEALRKSNVKKLFFIKRDSKINIQTFVIVVTKSTIIDASIIKLFLNEFNYVQHSKSLNKIKYLLKNIFRNVIAKININKCLI